MLTLVYMAFAGLGCLYVVLAAFLGHTADVGGHDTSGAGGGGHAAHAGGHGSAASGHASDVGGHSGDAGDTAYGVGGGGHGGVHATAPAAASFHFPFFSPLALATLVAAIGGYGLIAKAALGAGDGASLAMAVPAAVLTAYGVTYVGWRLVSGSTSSSLIRLEDLAGGAAEVTVPIPAGGVGEAMAIAGGQRYAAPAREVAGLAVARGATVTIVAAGPTLVVRAGPPAPPAHADGSAGSAGGTGGTGGALQGDRSHG
ncbi:MAG TPA: hypothetical protein VOA80_01070 [Thermoanaerobaculia bacterium]|nr:hypothetical protein [Thermoanaerobaculia bacterium]